MKLLTVCCTDGECITREDGAGNASRGDGEEGGWDVGDEDIELPADLVI